MTGATAPASCRASARPRAAPAAGPPRVTLSLSRCGQAEDRSGQYAVAAETAFGGLAARSSITRATALEHARDPGLRSIPSQWLHAGLACIKIQACKLARLPDALGELCPALERLYITHNQIACLPASCGKLPRLRELGLTANAFLEFPECVQVRCPARAAQPTLVCVCVCARAPRLSRARARCRSISRISRFSRCSATTSAASRPLSPTAASSLHSLNAAPSLPSFPECRISDLEPRPRGPASRGPWPRP